VLLLIYRIDFSQRVAFTEKPRLVGIN